MELNMLTLRQTETIYYNANIGIPIAIGIFAVVQIINICIALVIIPDLEVTIRWLLYLLCVPFIIVLLAYPFLVKIVVNKVDNTIFFRWMSCIPYIWNCKDLLFQINEIDSFKLDNFYLFGKKYYKIFAKLKNNPDDILVISGQDQSCSFSFSDKLQKFTDRLNGFIRT